MIADRKSPSRKFECLNDSHCRHLLERLFPQSFSVFVRKETDDDLRGLTHASHSHALVVQLEGVAINGVQILVRPWTGPTRSVTDLCGLLERFEKRKMALASVADARVRIPG